jgi:hypothetical protein
MMRGRTRHLSVGTSAGAFRRGRGLVGRLAEGRDVVVVAPDAQSPDWHERRRSSGPPSCLHHRPTRSQRSTRRKVARVIDPAVRSWTPESEPIGVGTPFTIRGRLGAVPIRGTNETVTWDPPHLAVYRTVRPTWPFRMTAEHRFDADGDDRTRYTWTPTPVTIARDPSGTHA